MASEHSNRVRVSSPVLREAPEHASCSANVMPKTSQMERPTKGVWIPHKCQSVHTHRGINLATHKSRRAGKILRRNQVTKAFGLSERPLEGSENEEIRRAETGARTK
jgi:hypothetical protein